MNKKTFTLALFFLLVALAWFAINIYWFNKGGYCVGAFDLSVAVLFVLAGVFMVWNECQKRRRKHIEEINKHKIP